MSMFWGSSDAAMRLGRCGAFLGAAVFALWLSGCGGGSGGPSNSEAPRKTTSTPDAAPTVPASSDGSTNGADSGAAGKAEKSETPSGSTTGDSKDNEKSGGASVGGTGILEGTVTFAGEYKPLPLLVKAGDSAVKDAAVCAHDDVPNESLLVDANAGNGVANVFVYLPRTPKGYDPGEAPSDPVVIDQKGCQFIPHASVVRVGQPAIFTSSDAVSHNVHTFPAFSAPFNQICQPNDKTGLKLVYERGEREPVSVKCDIHPWMQAWQLPVDHPFAAVTDAAGKFRIEGIPAGAHKFSVWHEKAGFVEKALAVTITANETTTISLTINADQLADITPSRTVVVRAGR